MRNVKVPNWLEELPLAPEYHPTDTEFADPIAYISKIEKEASKYGICKIIPPLPKPSKKYVISNLTKSLSKRPELDHVTRPSNYSSRPSAVFTTRQQELGNNGKKKLVRKQVWQSGEVYTLDQFESKAKAFYRERLGDVKSVCPLVIETLFWEAACDKPIYIEYANDVPGSGFSEPVGPCRFLNNKRRRKRTNFRRSCASMESEVVPVVFSGQELKGLDSFDNMEGSAGWKLSNSPWNLQLIARSLGSLTRFMADDIPGVTSPMIYIGMLFSWFAWHVEDHELHSMNFLHTGSQKTWYAVPGYYADAFEDVVRRQAYGIDVDRLDSLTMLGEKTTLLSPEAIVDSGIPCCRLVQNPGEFVVTFPRAYHVGFSHGFNCGEAANFGTAKWLEVAREAAVRRAAMNHLPMLSHQQLLYLLTMSFVSSIPRSLLPGARNSRLRDRLKDERELSVKKAFLDDILNENKLLSTVLRSSGSNRIVLWDLESLPSVIKVPEPCSPSNTVEYNISSERKNKPDLLQDMNLYMENVNDLYIDTDDLSGDFQLCSGSLACVACGVLGFPFMSVVQPSERASMNLMEDVSMPIHDHSHSLPILNRMVDPVSVGATENIGRCEQNFNDHSNGEALTRDPYPIEVPKVSVGPQVQKGWCSTRGFLRPRIFCLEHAVHIKHMLNLKGGANVLVICHSDFKKMEVHAAAIKEQIGSPSRYSEVPLDSATQDDLNIIDLAIEDEEHDEYGNDWTSKLGINLRHCVKMRRNCPCNPEHHPFVLGGLFSVSDSSFNSFDLKWPFTKSRSKNVKKSSEHTKIGSPGLGNLKLRIKRETGQLLVVKSDADTIRNKPKLIQYSRRTSTFEPGDSMGKDTLMKQLPDEALVTDCSNQNEHSIEYRSPKNLVVQTECSAKESSDLSIFAFNGNCNSQFETPVSVFSQATCPVAPGDRNTGDSRGDDFEMQNEMEVDNGSKKFVTSGAEDSVCSVVMGIDPQHSIIQGENKSAVDVSAADAGCIDNYDNYSSEGILRMKETCNVVGFAPSCCSDAVTAMSNAQREEKEVERKYVEKQDIQGTHEDKEPASISETGDCVEKQGTQETHEDKEPVSLGDTLIDKSSVVLKDVSREVSITNAVGEMHDGFLSSYDTGELETTVLNMVCKKSPIKYRRKKRRELHLQVDNQGTNEAKEPAPRSDALINQFSVVSEDASRQVSLMNAVAETPPSNEELEKAALTTVSQKSPVKYRRKGRRELDLKVDNPGVHEAKEPVPSHDTQIDQTYLVPRDMIMSREVSITNAVVEMHSNDKHSYPGNEELGKVALAMVYQNSIVKAKRKRRRELDLQFDNPYDFDGFTRSPCEGLRPRSSNHTKCGKINSNKVIKQTPTSKESCEGVRLRSSKPAKDYEVDISKRTKEKPILKKSTKPSNRPLSRKDKKRNEKKTHKCDLINCKMWFHTKEALKLHKRNQCPLKGCGKKFSCHRYAVVHQRVHDDDRPLKCPWKGCGMTFKWSWSRIEHMRKHTGERPYSCKVEGCGLSFRFISDYSRHRRKTGHYVTPQT